MDPGVGVIESKVVVSWGVERLVIPKSSYYRTGDVLAETAPSL